MNNKIYALAMILILVTITISGCGNSTEEFGTMSTKEGLEGFFPFDGSLLESESKRAQIEEYLLQINPDLQVSKGHYAIGDLDGDEIPEIAMYIQRSPQDMDDQGALKVYGYDSSAYTLIDQAPMNYDNTNYILRIGNLSENQQGILLSNQVGSKAGVTYGFILDHGELVNILNPKKVNLFSVTTDNSIEDIDGDGILEFSTYSIDPETNSTDPAGADTIELWYRWDGKDSAYVIEGNADAPQEMMIMSAPAAPLARMATEGGPYPGDVGLRGYLLENVRNYSPGELTDLLGEHLISLEVNSSYRSLDVETLFAKYMKNYTFDTFFEKYGLSQERLNDREYLLRDRILQSEIDLKDMLIRNIDLGYSLVSNDGRYSYDIDYSGFANDFGSNITNEFRKYLIIMAKESENPHSKGETLLIDKESLADRIMEIEGFRLTYSYSHFMDEILEIYESYMTSMFFLTSEGYVFDPATGNFKGGSKEELQDIVNKYPESHMADVINLMLTKVRTSAGTITPAIREEILSTIP